MPMNPEERATSEPGSKVLLPTSNALLATGVDFSHLFPQDFPITIEISYAQVTASANGSRSCILSNGI